MSDKLVNEQKNLRVNFLKNYEDYQVYYYSLLGLSTKYVAEKTGYTLGRVTYRRQKAGVRLGEYRNGRSDIAKLIVDKMEASLRKRIKQRIKLLEKYNSS